MADSDLIKLYSGRILELASDIPLTERLEAPDSTVRKRSPLCGSTVTVDVALEEGRISAFGQDVKACTLGQASASILARNVIGLTRAEVERARDQLRAMLTDGGAVPMHRFRTSRYLCPLQNSETGIHRSSFRLMPRPTLWPKPRRRPAPSLSPSQS